MQCNWGVATGYAQGEECMEYIAVDEYLEVTPKSLRIRKILLDENDRKKASKAVVEA
ncbi:MAG: hypothetical protein JNL43_03625 [Flavobacteriales bacterium]|nr:hypothetical protein [Flavobacteriales bacterium]